MSDPIIRNGNKDDAAIIVSLYWRHEISLGRIEEVRAAIMSLPSKVAEIEGTIVGFVYCRAFAPDILEIDNLFVDVAYRNKKVGAILIHHLEQEAIKKYSGLILINSDLYGFPVIDKRDPRNFYIRQGYELVFSTSGSRIFMKRLS